MRDTPLAAITVPDASDVADVPTHMYGAMTDAEKYLNLVFASATARNAAFTAAGVAPVEGQQVFLSDTKTSQIYLGGTWVNQESVVICTASSRPTPTHVGMRIYETDAKSYRTWDGTNWVPDRMRLFGAGASAYGPAVNLNTHQTLFQAGTLTQVSTWSGVEYFLTLTFPNAFPTACIAVNVTPVGPAAVGAATPYLGGITNTKADVYVPDVVSLSTTVSWMAWGY